jgi:hypothetical protein
LIATKFSIILSGVQRRPFRHEGLDDVKRKLQLTFDIIVQLFEINTSAV